MKALTISILCLFNPFLGITQNAFVIEDKIPTKDVTVTALIINVTDDYDEVIDNYKKYVKENYKMKVKKENSNTYQIEAVDVSNLSQKRGDLRTYLLPTDSMNLIAFSFVLGYDIFLNSQDYPDEMIRFKKFVVSFMEYHYDLYFSNRIEATNKELIKLKKDLGKSDKKINSLNKKAKSIHKKASKEDDQSKIAKLNADLQNIENEKNAINRELPERRFNVIDKEKQLISLKEEGNYYHQLITTLYN